MQRNVQVANGWIFKNYYDMCLSFSYDGPPGGGGWARNWWQNYLYFREFKFSVFYELVRLIKSNKTYPWSNSFLQHNYIFHFKIQLLEVRNSFKGTCQLLWISVSYATYMVSDNTTLNINFFKIIYKMVWRVKL